MSLNDKEIVKIGKILDGSIAMPNQGKILYELLVDLVINKHMKLVLDFSGIDIITTAFLNFSIGKFIIENGLQSLQENVGFINIDKSNDLIMLRTVIEDARKISYLDSLNKVIE